MRLYHTTTASAAEAIVQGVFQDKTDSYMFVGLELTGVWFANRPLGASERARGDPVDGAPVLVIEMDEAENCPPYEVVGEPEIYREWCIPAELVNHHPRRVIYDPVDEALSDEWWVNM